MDKTKIQELKEPRGCGEKRMNEKKESEFDYFAFADQIIRLCESSFNGKDIQQGWRVLVKERIDSYFGQEIPWDLCIGGMNLVWNSHAAKGIDFVREELKEQIHMEDNTDD